MAIPKPLISVLFLAILVLHCLVRADDHSENEKVVATTSTSMPMKIDCVSACNGRCQLSSRQRMCHRACQTCCVRCNCVPPGTSGNRESCPCYATMTTHGGRLKCP